MKLQERLQRNLAEKGREANEQDFQNNSWHSRYYHRYFKDYKEILESSEDGRPRIRRIYVGSYHEAQVSAGKWLGLKLGYCALTVVSFAVFAAFALQSNPVNMTWYGVLPQVAALCAYLFLAWFLIGRLFAPQKLTKQQYAEYSKNVKLIARVAGLSQFGGGAVALGHWFLCAGPAAQLMQAAGFVCSALGVLAIWWLEGKIPYIVVGNTNKAPEGAVSMSENA